MISQVPLNPKTAPPRALVAHAEGQFGRSLTPRQRQIAALVAQGHLDKEIAELSGLTMGTVKVYLHCIYARCGITGGNRRVLLARLVWQEKA